MKRTQAMKIATGLPYEERMSSVGKLYAFGVLGKSLLTVTAKDQSGTGALHQVRKHIKARWATIECNLEEPRHIGTHDGHDVGTKIHFHLAKAGGGIWSPIELEEVEQIISTSKITFEAPRKPWSSHKKKFLKKVRSSRLGLLELAHIQSFIEDKSVSGEDLAVQKEIISLVASNKQKEANKLWKAARQSGWLKWRPPVD